MRQTIPVHLRRKRVYMLWLLVLVALTMALPLPVSAAAPDPVLEWMKITNDTIIAAGTNPLFSTRQVALVSASVFDAVNGIGPRRYEPIRVTAKAPPHASQRAAAIQAAYAILMNLYPGQMASLTTRRNASIDALLPGPEGDRESIQAGVDWGQAVADAIWAWRSTDGFSPPPPPFLGILGRSSLPIAVGVWRPTPKADGSAGLSGAGPQFATMTPWVMLRPSQFRPGPPYPLLGNGQFDFSSAQYLADYHETKDKGAYSGSPRAADQSELALFWAGNTPLFWIRIASQISAAQQLTLPENAHLFALLNVAMADAGIACWDAKYRYVLWRPITAIREGSVDPDPSWKPWLDFFAGGTPAHPEFPSGHSTVSGAAVFILKSAFGDNTPFTIDSDTRPGIRSFASFSAALAEIHDARVFGGIHWRTACRVGSAVGEAVAQYVSTNAMRLREGD
jgi:PAP2 superfamily